MTYTDKQTALLKKAGMSEKTELTEPQAKRLKQLVRLGDKLPSSYTGGTLANAIQQGKDMPAAARGKNGKKQAAKPTGTKAKADSLAARTLAEAVKIMNRASKPLSRIEIEERLEKAGVPRGKGTWRPSDTVCLAEVEKREVNGYRIIRPERGRYTTEKVK